VPCDFGLPPEIIVWFDDGTDGVRSVAPVDVECAAGDTRETGLVYMHTGPQTVISGVRSSQYVGVGIVGKAGMNGPVVARGADAGCGGGASTWVGRGGDAVTELPVQGEPDPRGLVSGENTFIGSLSANALAVAPPRYGGVLAVQRLPLLARIPVIYCPLSDLCLESKR
jgi:hypothetical protein